MRHGDVSALMMYGIVRDMKRVESQDESRDIRSYIVHDHPS